MRQKYKNMFNEMTADRRCQGH